MTEQELIQHLRNLGKSPEWIDRMVYQWKKENEDYNNPETSPMQKRLAMTLIMEIEENGEFPDRELMRESLDQFKMYVKK